MSTSKMCLVLTISVVVVVVVVCCGQVTGKKDFKRDIMYPNYHEPPIHFDGPHNYPMRGRGPHKHGHQHHNRPVPIPEESLSREIPLAFLERLNDISNISDFFELVTGFENDTFNIDTRFNFGNERKSVVTPKLAKCLPEERTVALAVEDPDPSLFYYPSCTRVKRCGGCCSTSIMSCQPTETQPINFQVVATQYSGDSQLQFKGKMIVTVEEHTKCKCMCTVKAEHCNQFQEYRPNECRCECVNVDERQKCLADNDTKVWNPNDCACTCREVRDCTTGSLFNPLTCRCAAIPDRMTRRHVGNSDVELQLRLRLGDKTATKHQPRPVVPFQ